MDGVFIINKPKGITSNGVVQKIRRILGTKQIGHCGTLDPLATGVLPILVGKGTKISKYLVEHNKTYIATIQLGEKRTTADCEGEIIQTKKVKQMSKKEIKDVLSTFIGKQMQNPPKYSAIKKDGKKLYEYAREGIEVEIEPREIEISNIEFIDYNKDENKIKYKVKCSKGTYIRSLCEDIAQKLDTVGYMSELIRTNVNEFTLVKSYTLEELEQNKENISEKIITIEELFKDKEKIVLNDRKCELLLNGVMLTYKLKDGIYCIYSKEKFIGLGVIKDELLKRDVII